MFKYMLVGIFAVMISGCAAIKSPLDGGYQFGDMTKSALAVQAKYCAESDPVKRAMMLTVIKSSFPDFPASGACTELHTLIDKEQVADIAKDVDLEKAVEDRKKFQSK